ncbi:MAG: hypothetical protein ACYCSG_02605 [Thermoplasmataceae archaeon]
MDQEKVIMDVDVLPLTFFSRYYGQLISAWQSFVCNGWILTFICYDIIEIEPVFYAMFEFHYA